MKKYVFALTLLFAGLLHAETESIVFPRVYHFGNRVQVEVWNTSRNYVTCSGTIYMQTQSGNRETAYYFDTIAPRFNSHRSFYLRSSNDRISYVNHGIFCR